jgi:hypothetical protein
MLRRRLHSTRSRSLIYHTRHKNEHHRGVALRNTCKRPFFAPRQPVVVLFFHNTGRNERFLLPSRRNAGNLFPAPGPPLVLEKIIRIAGEPGSFRLLGLQWVGEELVLFFHKTRRNEHRLHTPSHSAGTTFSSRPARVLEKIVTRVGNPGSLQVLDKVVLAGKQRLSGFRCLAEPGPELRSLTSPSSLWR